MSGAWSIGVKNASTATLTELYGLLKEAKNNPAQALEIQKELIARLRAQGRTTREIVNALVAGVAGRKARSEIAKEWSEAVGITATEFRRLAGS